MLKMNNLLYIAFILFVYSSASMGEVDSFENHKSLVIKGFYIGMPSAEVVSLVNTKYLSVFEPPTMTFCETTDELGLKRLDNDSYYLRGSREPWRRYPIAPVSIKDTEIVLGKHYNGRYFPLHTRKELKFDRCFVFDNEFYMNSSSTPPWNSNFVFDKKGQLESFYFRSDEVNQLFNVKDLGWQAFAEEFSKGYGLPNLKPEIYTNSWFAKEESMGSKLSNGSHIFITKSKELHVKAAQNPIKRTFD